MSTPQQSSSVPGSSGSTKSSKSGRSHPKSNYNPKQKRPESQGGNSTGKQSRGGKKAPANAPGKQKSNTRQSKDGSVRNVKSSSNPNTNPNKVGRGTRRSGRGLGSGPGAVNGKKPSRSTVKGGRGASRRGSTPKNGKPGQDRAEPNLTTPKHGQNGPEKFAWSAFQNSPDPNELPMPSFSSRTALSGRNKVRSQSTNSTGKRDIEYAAQYLPKSPMQHSRRPTSFGPPTTANTSPQGPVSNVEASQHLKTMLGLLGPLTSSTEED